MASNLNPKTTHYEFMGPPGALFVTLAVPLTTYSLYFLCNDSSGGCLPSLWAIPPRFFGAVKDQNWWFGLFELRPTALYLAWYLYCVAAWVFLPGAWVEGVQMRDGNKKSYKVNAFSTFLLTMGITAGALWSQGPSSFAYLYDHWVGLTTASLLMAIFQSFACYFTSYQGGKLLALGGNTGNFIYDFFIGRELNPSIGRFDVKYFNELRPGLILWILLNISAACEQYTRTGGITDSMVLINVFQFIYVADGLYNEPAILTTMDITTDGFGFMLAVGDLVWVPFVYSLQARFLAFNPVSLGPSLTTAVLALNLTGYYIFRVSNSEKDVFRNGKNPKNLKYLTTERGSKLITSGWWGRSRHPNYLGDLLMGLAWSLTTGFSTPLTYFYPAYFLILLVHRQMRDDENCEKKYGKDWQRYQKLVPWRIIPYIY